MSKKWVTHPELVKYIRDAQDLINMVGLGNTELEDLVDAVVNLWGRDAMIEDIIVGNDVLPDYKANLEEVFDILDAPGDWSPDTIEAVAEVVQRSLGKEIRDPNEIEGSVDTP